MRKMGRIKKNYIIFFPAFGVKKSSENVCWKKITGKNEEKLTKKNENWEMDNVEK